MPTIYWYQDLSCRSECNFPYNLVIHNSVEQCLKPCPRSEYFYDLEKECHASCEPPYTRQTINTIKVCHIDAATLALETSKIKKTAEVMQTFGKASSAVIKATSMPQVTTPRTGLLVQLSAMIQYYRYMRINYPWKVQALFQANDASLISLNIDFSIPNKVEGKFDNYPLPDVFEKYHLDSNFINNMWDLINTILLVLLGIPVLLFMRKALKRSLKLHHVLTKILQIFRWNLLLAIISTGSGEIIFYASLQIRSTPLDSAVSFVSFFVSLIMIFWVLVLLVICLQILRGFHRQARKTTPATSENQDWLDKWKGYEMLYEEIEGKSLFSLAYMAIYIMRAILFFAIIANFYDYPLAQSISITVINFLIFIYLLFCKPLKDLWISVQLLLSEILGNIFTICVLTLAILDRAEIDSQDSRVAIGNVIVVVMLMFYILGLGFLIIKAVLFSIETYKTWKEMRARGIKNPLKMIQILIFGETTTKAHPEDTALELSHNSSSIALQQSYIQKFENDKKDYCDNKITEKDSSMIKDSSSMISDTPLDLSSAPIHPVDPVEIKVTGSNVRGSQIQNHEPEIEVFKIFRPEQKITQKERKSQEKLPKKINPDDSISEVVLSTTPEPSSQPSGNFIQSWGNLKARLKRFNLEKK